MPVQFFFMIFQEILLKKNFTKLLFLICERVTLKKVTPTCLSNNDPFYKQESSGDLELLPLPSGDYSAFAVEHTFSWQQKVLLETSELNGVDSDVLTKGKCQASLFSYVDGDFSLKEWQRRSPLTHPPCESYLEKKMSVRYRGKNFAPKSRAVQKTQFADGKPIIHMPKKQSSSQRLQGIGQFMSIMVAFNPYDSLEKEERELCILHLDPDGCLEMKPDFSINEVPYIIQNNKSETFEYLIEFASKDIESLEAQTEKNIVKKLNLKRMTAMAALVGSDFDRPSSSIKFFLNGEIASAGGFQCDNLYIRYYVELPEDWSIENEDLLNGSTYSCRSKWIENKKVAFFGFPLSLELEADMERAKEDYLIPGVHLYVEVISLDRWNNGRGEGYGYATIPFRPGSYSVTINTWKILPASIVQRLQHFFIGGVSYLEDISYIRIPNSSKEQQLSKYGFKTESSGSIQVSYHAVLQIGSEVDKSTANIDYIQTC